MLHNSTRIFFKIPVKNNCTLEFTVNISETLHTALKVAFYYFNNNPYLYFLIKLAYYHTLVHGLWEVLMQFLLEKSLVSGVKS